jgi:hypothetical protein
MIIFYFKKNVSFIFSQLLISALIFVCKTVCIKPKFRIKNFLMRSIRNK